MMFHNNNHKWTIGSETQVDWELYDIMTWFLRVTQWRQMTKMKYKESQLECGRSGGFYGMMKGSPEIVSKLRTSGL